MVRMYSSECFDAESTYSRSMPTDGNWCWGYIRWSSLCAMEVVMFSYLMHSKDTECRITSRWGSSCVWM